MQKMTSIYNSLRHPYQEYSPEKAFADRKDKYTGSLFQELYKKIINYSTTTEWEFFKHSIVSTQWCCLVRERICELINSKNLFLDTAVGTRNESNALAFIDSYKNTLKTLRFPSTFSQETFFKMIHSLPNLTSLSLVNSWIPKDLLQKIFPLKNLSALSIDSLNLGDDEFTAIIYFTKLTELSICFSKITNKTLLQIPIITSLLKLTLRACENITDKGLKHLRSLNLKKLNLSECSNITGKPLGQMQTLSSLNLAYTGVGSSDDDDFDWIEHLINLSSLNLQECFITGKKIKHLRLLTNLSKLTTNDNIGDNISKLTSLINLTKLNIHSDITSLSFPYIGRFTKLSFLAISSAFLNKNLYHLKSLTKLKHLSLQNTDFDECIYALHPLTKLTKLELSGNITIAEREFGHFQNLFELKVNYSNNLCRGVACLTSLRALSIFQTSDEITVNDLDFLARLTNLSSLSIPNHKSLYNKLKILTSLKNLSTLFLGCHSQISPLILSEITSKPEVDLALVTHYCERMTLVFSDSVLNFLSSLKTERTIRLLELISFKYTQSILSYRKQMLKEKVFPKPLLEAIVTRLFKNNDVFLANTFNLILSSQLSSPNIHYFQEFLINCKAALIQCAGKEVDETPTEGRLKRKAIENSSDRPLKKARTIENEENCTIALHEDRKEVMQEVPLDEDYSEEKTRWTLICQFLKENRIAILNENIFLFDINSIKLLRNA